MKVAAIYDIHGNLPALEAVIDEIMREKIDLLVVGGDVVLGPMSQEALTFLLDINIPKKFIKGNCEVAVLAEMNHKKYTISEQARESVRWTSMQLNSEHKRLLSSWPATFNCHVRGLGKVLFCHATPQNENDIFTQLTPEENLLSVFSGVNVEIIICGHTHMQFDRRIGDVRVVNAGSVGMPFGATGADWIMLDQTIQFRHTDYDLENAAERIRDTKYPQAQEFAKNYVLNTPSKSEMLKIYAASEIGRQM
ncbi:MAG: metallophosphoesterase family protein [Balneolaceae bacterium]|jgi:putative phosphoesterase